MIDSKEISPSFHFSFRLFSSFLIFTSLKHLLLFAVAYLCFFLLAFSLQLFLFILQKLLLQSSYTSLRPKNQISLGIRYSHHCFSNRLANKLSRWLLLIFILLTHRLFSLKLDVLQLQALLIVSTLVSSCHFWFFWRWRPGCIMSACRHWSLFS